MHGLFQLFAYLVYTAAIGIGIWMATQAPERVGLLHSYHPVIGLILFAFLFFQPVLGYIHHLRYKKYQCRTVWSYGHLWLGRIGITLGMINGGLGLFLASDAPLGFAPSRGQIIAYGVVAGIMWLLWITAAVVGERRRSIPERNIDDESSSVSSLARRKERYPYVNNHIAWCVIIMLTKWQNPLQLIFCRACTNRQMGIYLLTHVIKACGTCFEPSKSNDG